MKRVLLLITVAALLTAPTAFACELKAVQVTMEAPCEVLALPALPGVSELVTLAPVPEVPDVKTLAVGARAFAVRASVTLDREESERCVLLTVLEAVGKAVLKAVASLILRAV
jgi:hypothetical protein